MDVYWTGARYLTEDRFGMMMSIEYFATLHVMIFPRSTCTDSKQHVPYTLFLYVLPFELYKYPLGLPNTPTIS